MAAFSLHGDLQRDIFTPQKERLLAVSTVWKASKKRKEAILCAAVSLDSWEMVSLATVKCLRGNYKVSSRWSATELSLVDGKDAVKETTEFHLHLDKVYQWETISPLEKKAFVACLWKINQRYLQERVKFVNITPDILDEVLPWQHCGVSEEQEEEEGAFQELTARETASVERLLEESELAMSDAEAFAQGLHASLANMDQENVQAMMTSEIQAEQLLCLLDEAFEELGNIEEVLSQHDRLLRGVQRQMENLYKNGALLQHLDHNHRQLCTELCHLVDGLSLSEDHIHILTKGDLDDKEQVQACVKAVTALSQCSKTHLSAGQRRLQGVAEQLIRFESVRQIFEQRLTQHINNVIMEQVPVKESWTEGETWLKTASFHRQLLEYSPLMSWLRDSSPQVFQQLIQVYAENIGKLFDQQMKNLFDGARLQILGSKEAKKAGPCVTSDSSGGSVPLPTDRRASGVVERVLIQLESVCVEEQEFLTKFFSLDSGPEIIEFPAGRRCSAVDQAQSFVELRQKRRPHSWCRFSGGGGPPEPGFGDEWDCVRAVLGPAEARLWPLLGLCEEAEPLSFLSTLKIAHLCLSRRQDNPAASFCCSLLRGALQHCQCRLRSYTESLSREMESARGLKRSRQGILPFVLRLEEFVREGQRVLGGSERRCWGLDKAYTQLLSTALRALDGLSGQSARCSPLVVKLRNLHRLAGFLGGMGLPELGPLWEEAKERTAQQVREYVHAHLGQPLGRLSDFLAGVQSCLAHGVGEEEVCFQLAYSKQELRRLTALHSGPEVKCTLELLHKKTRRELGEDPALLQVVWTAVEQDFTAQYRSFEDIVIRCYPGAGVSLASSEQHVQELFHAISENANPGI